jgi:Chaperone of endosialidase
MSYYKLFQTDIIQASQLYLGGGVNAGLPVAGLNLYSDGQGGTFWSSVSGGGGTTNAITSSLLTSTVDGLGNVGYVSTSYLTAALSNLSSALSPAIAIGVAGTGPGGTLTNANLQSTVLGLGNLYISTNQVGLGNIVSFAQLYSTTAGLTSSINITSSQITSTTAGLGTIGYISTQHLTSTVAGLATSGYISSSQLTSTIVGLGRLYVSVNNVLFSPDVARGISTLFLSSGVGTFGTLNANSNVFFTNAPTSLTYTTAPITTPLSITTPTGIGASMTLNAGTTNTLSIGVDGNNNATIISQAPTVSGLYNPLTLGGSLMTALTSSLTITPFVTANPYNNNTQIIGSTISTGAVLANLFSGDGSRLFNLNAISSATLTSYTQSTMISTVFGLNNYLGYLSANAVGPVVFTSSINASSLLVRGSVTAANIIGINPMTANIWVAAGQSSNALGTLETSIDGLNWTSAASGGFSVTGTDVAWNGSLWVAVGQDASPNNTIQYTSNGSNWTSITANGFTGSGQGVAWNGFFWVAVGADATPANTIKYSSDGINWNNSLGPGFAVQGLCIMWNGRVWVAVGQSASGAILYSSNTSNWFVATGYSGIINTVKWNGRFWLAGGTAAVLYQSRDGVTWTTVPGSFSAAIMGLTWNGVVWILQLNTSGNTYYSYDGLVWASGSGPIFLSGGRDGDWNGSFFIGVGADSTQTSLIKQSRDGINWINSTSNNFVSAVNNISYSSNLTSFYAQDNFNIMPQNIPLFLNSTNKILVSRNALTLNNTLYLDGILNRLGVNCNAPSFDLDVYGNINVNSNLYASNVIARTLQGDGSLLYNLNAVSTPSLQSSIQGIITGLGSLGYLSTTLSNLDYSSLSLSSLALYNTSTLNGYFGSTVINLLSTFNRTNTSTVFISTSFSTLNAFTINASSLTTSTLLASTILTSNLIVSSLVGQFANINNLSTNDLKAQRLLVSTLRFFDGDGTLFFADLQGSNISTIAMYTSSILTNSILASNIRVGTNSNQSPITFFGLRGGFNNTAIAEQSTSLSTQELLIFRGSSIGDQVRIQTTGGFRVETGVSGRFFPATAQLSTTAFQIDSFSNVTMNNSTFYLNAASSFVGINCNAPGVALDVNGAIRAASLQISTLITSSVQLSTITTGTATIQRLQVSSLRFYDGDGFIVLPDVQTSNISSIALYTSSIAANTLVSYSYVSTPAVITSSLVVNSFSVSSISTQILATNNLLVSSATISTLVAPTLTTQRLLVSSIRFHDGDGFIALPDHQTSNISSMVLYTSTILTNTIAGSNIRLGFNQIQTAMNFYGTTGAFNNTAIIEQSTSFNTQELLLFRGSSLTDQVRVQTTGAFRVEVGVPARLFPNMGQVATPSLYIDPTSNVTMGPNTFYLNPTTSYVGINTNSNAGGIALDVNGVIRGSGALLSNIAYQFPSAVSTSSLFVSSITGVNGFFSTITMSSLQTTRVAALVVSTQSLVTNTFAVNNFQISTLNTAFANVQSLTTSSLAFFGGDGIVNIPDLQTSNVSSIAMYASSITTNAIASSNIRIGSNVIQNSINFYGRTGGFNNTVIAEQSTGTIAQELLLFKGSSPSDQVRIQTTGGFRVETGVPARLFPNMSQLPTSVAFQIDSLSNVTMATSTFVLTAANNFIGINNNAPGVALDVTGTIRATNANFTNLTFTNLALVTTSLSSLNASSFTANVAQISTLIPSTFYMNTLSSLYQLDVNATANFSTLGRVYVQPPLINLWVAAGSANNALAYSSDGVTWTGIPATTATFGTAGYGAAWNGKIWVAVGQGTNSICYSPNGSNWTAIPNGSTTFTTGARTIAWNGSRFIAGGSGTNCLAYSSDGINWASITHAAGPFSSGGQVNGIAWNGRLWVAVGSGTNSIAYSSDGLTWIGLATSATNFSTAGFGIAWNGRLWVAVGSGTNSICYSLNGINWTPISNTQINTFTTQGYGVAWNGILFVAVGSGTNSIIYSYDGINWLPVPNSTTIFSTNGQNIAWNGFRWVAVGFGTNSFASSADGINWSVIASGSSVFTTSGLGVAYSSNAFQAYSQQTLDINPQNIPIFFRSTNQIFNSISSMVINDTLAVDRTYNFVGINCNAPQFNLDVVGAANISTFTKINVQPYTFNRFVAVGSVNNTLAYSADGITWAGIGTAIFGTAGYGVGWNGIRWVAVGQGTNSIAYSADGISWIGIGAGPFSSSGRGVAWNGLLWVAVGIGAANTIAYSSDGINWTGAGLTIFSTAGYGVGWSGIRWVAVGSGLNNTIATSPDGITWTGQGLTAFTTQGSAVQWNGIRWVAVGAGTNTVAYSPDGISWTGLGLTIFTTQGNALAWSGLRWVAVGAGTNAIAYSLDGINWTAIPFSATTFTTSGNGIAWHGKAFYAVGTGTNGVSYSPDGINWTGIALASSPFTTQGNGIAWSSNVTPSYTQLNLDILPQNIPTFLRSTNQIFIGPSSILMNDTLIVDRAFKNVGINCNAPRVTLDVGGIIRAPTAIISTLNASTLNVSSGTISSLLTPFLTVQNLLVSSFRFYDGNGFVFIPDLQASNVSAISMYTSSLLTNTLNAATFISAPIYVGSTFTTNTLLTSSLSTQTLTASNIITSSLSVSSMTVPLLTTQRLQVSSLRFYDGDGVVQMPDLQTSNISSMAFYTSSVLTNTVTAATFISGPILITSSILATALTLSTLSTVTLATSTIFAQTTSSVILNALAGTMSSLTVSTVTAPTMIAQRLLVSSLRFYDGDGFVTMPDLQTSNISSIAIYTSTLLTNAVTAANFISGPLHIGSTFITNTLVTSSISTQTLVTSSLTVSSLTVPLLTSQRLLVSSIRFYDGDGFLTMPDIQTSNISTSAFYTSSILAITTATSNIRVGSNALQSPITFYGTTGGFNNTLIAEQSTSFNTQELLFFRGSSIADQFRFQTTGGFRIETGVTPRLATNPTQLTFPTLLVDAFSNVAVNSNQFYINGTTGFIGVNCNTPQFTLDVNGSMRVQALVTSSMRVSSLFTSTQTTADMTAQRMLVSSLRFYDGDGTITMPDMQSSNISTIALWTSSLLLNTVIAGNYISAPFAFTSSILTNNILGSTLSTQNVTTSNLLTSSATISTLTAPVITVQRLLISSMRFFDGDGIVAMPDMQGSNISSMAIYTSSLLTNTITAATFISTPILVVSSLTVNNLTVGNTISTTTFYASSFYSQLNSTGILNVNAGSFSTAGISTLTTANATAQRLLVSSLRFYDGDGIVTMPDIQSSNISTIAMYTSSITATSMIVTNYISTPLMVVSSFVVNNLTVNNTLSTTTFYASTFTSQLNSTNILNVNVGTFISANISTVTTANIISQRLLVSSLRFYDGDGFISMPDHTASNISTSAFYTSSIVAITTTTSNIKIGSNALQSPITFYGTTGNFNNTLIAEQSTSYNTQELLFFRGSSISDQIRFQTTGGFRIETGVPSRLATNPTQLTYPTFLVDAFSNVAVNSNQFYVNGTTGLVGINCNSPQFNLDVNGSMRVQSLITSSMRVSSLFTSTQTTADMTAQRMLVSSLRFYDGDGTITMPDMQSSNISTIALWTSSMLANTVTAANFISAPFAFTSSILTNNILGSTLSTQNVNTSNLFTSSATISTLTAPVITVQRLLISSMRFFDGDGVIAMPDMQGSNVSSLAMYTSSLVTNVITANFISSPLVVVSSFVVNNLTVNNTISTTTFYASSFYSQLNSTGILNVNAGTFSTLNAANTVFPVLTAQRGLFSSLRFYDGDGVLSIPDLQGSNVSSMALYTSSLTGNVGLFATNIGINSNTPRFNLDVNGIANVSSITRVNVAPAFSSNIWVAGGAGGNTLAYSSNGSTWLGLGATTFTTQANGIAYNGSLWVAVGQGTNSIAYSLNGINWTGIASSSATFSTQGFGVAWNGSLWVAVGQGGNSVCYSANGSNWFGLDSGSAIFSTAGRGVAWNGSLWVAVGAGTNTISYSAIGSNLASWTSIAIANTPFASGQGYAITWMGNQWVAGGSGANAIATSSNGSTWVGIPTGASTFTTQATGVAWNGTMIVAVGSGTNAVSWSRDGFNWNGIPYSANTLTSAGIGYGIVWSGSQWIGVGQPGTNSIFTSPDGVTWTGITANGTSNFTTSGYGIGYSSNTVPTYTQQNLDILPQNIPLFLRSTNQIMLAPSSIILNATLAIDRTYNRIGVNNTAPQFNLDVYGNSRISSLMIGDTGSFTSTNTTFQLSVFGTNGPARVGGTTWTQISDQRLKEQIVDADLDRCYADIKAIPLRRFTYTSSFFNTVALPDRNVLGFIAQEVKQLHPKAITVSEAFGVSDLNWLNIDQMNMSLYGAVKRMMQTNEELTSSVTGLQTTLGYCMSTITGGNV